MFFLLFIYFSPFSICKYTFFFPYNIIIYVKTKKKLIMLILERMVTLTCASPNRKPPNNHNGENQHCDNDFLFNARKAKKQIDIIVIIINNNYLCNQELKRRCISYLGLKNSFFLQKQSNKHSKIFTKLYRHEKRRKRVPQEGRKTRL